MHRLGALGFAEPNLGLKDIRLGLGWIKNNVAKFGGDPDRINILGVEVLVVPACSCYVTVMIGRAERKRVRDGFCTQKPPLSKYSYERRRLPPTLTIPNKSILSSSMPLPTFPRLHSYWTCSFPITPPFVLWSVCHHFPKERDREVTLPCSYRSTCLYIEKRRI